uniref:Uncharacterized protein n=1 Tax=Rhizophagus irregularis (strain DAOM 181602 / DAOM 197198 / MUCL 43194) TaxID=747089 RepID=U9TZR6_RHIID
MAHVHPKKGTYEAHTYLRIGQQLCHSHYMSIVEPYHTQNIVVSEIQLANPKSEITKS